MLLVYQIKVGLCLIVFYLLWKLLLSRETFHRFNRIALLVVMGVAMVLPWIRVSMGTSTVAAETMVMLDDLLVVPAGAVQPQQAAHLWSVGNIATAVYLLGMAVMLVWYLHSHLSLRRLLKKGRTESLSGGITLHVLPGDQSPFSYFSHIVISEKDYRDNAKEILIHEQAHVGLRHSLDVMFMSVVTLFQWWNPAAWLLSREMRQVHEFEADEAVLKEGVDVKQYQLLLIRKSVGDQLFSMANNFNYQSLKKRIRMMTIKKSSRWRQLRALAIVPVIALALLAFANPSMNAATPVKKTAKKTAVSKKQVKTDESKIFQSVEQMPQFPGGQAALIKFLQENVKYPPEAAKNDIQGRVMVQFVVEKTGEIGEVKVVRSVEESLDAEAVRVVKMLPKFTPGRQDGKAVAVWYTLPISFKTMSKESKP